MKLSNEIANNQRLLKNYLKKHGVVEARLKFEDGTIMDCDFNSSGTLLKLIKQKKIEYKKSILDKSKSQSSRKFG